MSSTKLKKILLTGTALALFVTSVPGYAATTTTSGALADGDVDAADVATLDLLADPVINVDDATVLTFSASVDDNDNTGTADNDVVVISAANGGVTVNAGVTLGQSVGAGNVIATTGDIAGVAIVNSGLISAGANTEAAISLASLGAGNGATITINGGAGTDGNVVGTITGGGGNDTLAFNTTGGDSVIDGAVDMGGGVDAVTVTGTNDVNFTGTVAADTITNSGTGTLDFDGDVTGNVNLAANSTVELADNADLTGALDNTSGTDGNGTLTLEGSSTVSGAVGSTNSLATLNAGANGSTSTFSSTVEADDINVTGTGTVNFGGSVTGDVDFNGNGTVSMANAANITGTVDNTSGADGAGTLTLQGSSTVSGAVGATNSLAAVNAGANGSTSTFSSTVNADDINVTGTGTVNFDGAVTGDMDFAGNGTISMADTMNITGTVDNTTGADGAGTLTLEGTNTISGAIGATNSLAAVNAGVTGETVTFSSTVNADDINVTGTGTLDFNGSVTGDMDFADNGTVTLADTMNITGTVDNTSGADGAGTLTLEGSSTISGAVGATNSLALISTGVTGETTTFSSTVDATEINVTGTGTVNFDGAVTGDIDLEDNGTITLTDADMTGTIDNITGTDGTGTLTLDGTSTISGAIGSTNSLGVVNAGVGGEAVTFSSTVNAADINVTGAGTVNFDGTVTGDVDFDANGTVTFADGVNMAGTIDNATGVDGAGTLTLDGFNTMSGAIGATNSLAMINAGVTGATSTFSSTVDTAGFTIGGGNVVFTDQLTMSGDMNFTADGTATFGDNLVSIGGDVITATDGQGSLTFLGDGTITGDVGTLGSRLKAFTISGASGNTVAVNGNMNAADTTSVGLNAVNVTGTFNASGGQMLSFGINDSTTFGSIASGGAATINAGTLVNLTINDSGYIANNTSFTLVDGTGGTGVDDLTAGNLTFNSAILSFTQDTTNDEDLVVIASRETLASQTGGNRNNTNVAQVLDALGTGGDAGLDSVQVALQNAATTEEINEILESLLPTVNGGAQVAAANTANFATDIVGARLRSGTEVGIASGNMQNGMAMWAQSFGTRAQQGARDDIDGYDANTFGVTVGMDTDDIFNAGTFGVAATYAGTEVESENANNTNSDINTYQVAAYGDIDLSDEAYLFGTVGYGWNTVEQTRYDVAGVTGNNATADYDSSTFFARTELGKSIAVTEGMTVTPTILANYIHLSNDGYTEDGSTADLAVGGDDLSIFELGVGLDAAWEFDQSNGSIVRPEISLGYRHDLIGDAVETTSRFTGGGASFQTVGTDPAQGTVNIGANVTWLTTSNWDLTAAYDYEFKEDFDAHSALVRARYAFE